MCEFETNEPCKTGNVEINKLIWEWFKDPNRRKLNISGPMLQEKELEFAKDLVNTEFKASNGWLEGFYKGNNIALNLKSGEKADVDIVVVEDSKKKFQPF